MQEIGETRTAMARGLMKYLEQVIDKNQKLADKYWVLVHAKPFPGNRQIIKQKFIIFTDEPPMMLSCMLFEVDNKEGKLTLCWSLPGDWPTWHREGEKPVPEVIGSFDKLERRIVYGPKAA